MMRKKLHLLWLTAAMAASLSSLVPLNQAHATGQGQVSEIKFEKGKSSAKIKGGVVRGESKRYVLWAKEGQSMSVDVASVEKNAVFQILVPPGKEFISGAGEEDDARHWSGQLPRSGKYVIIVGSTRGNAEFMLDLAVGTP